MCRNYQIILMMAFSIIAISITYVYAQEMPIGLQNGVTWRNLEVGTSAETMTRKTFYVDGMYNMAVFWGMHANQSDTVGFDNAFIGMDVASIRDGLDKFYSDTLNLSVRIVDAVLIIKLEAAQVPNDIVQSFVKRFREIAERKTNILVENQVWTEALRLLK
ncbi:MAG: hypothetical protein ACP5US_08150 [Candidatus Kryptoniota bacterium]